MILAQVFVTAGCAPNGEGGGREYHQPSTWVGRVSVLGTGRLLRNDMNSVLCIYGEFLLFWLDSLELREFQHIRLKIWLL